MLLILNTQIASFTSSLNALYVSRVVVTICTIPATTNIKEVILGKNSGFAVSIATLQHK